MGLVFVTGSPGIDLETTQVIAVAAFLRVLNALENIRSAIEFINFAHGLSPSYDASPILQLVIADIGDAMEVLRGGGLHAVARHQLEEARDHVKKAMHVNNSKGKGRRSLDDALESLEHARDDMVA